MGFTFEWDIYKELENISKHGGYIMKKKIPDPNKMKKISGPKMTKYELRGAKIRVTTYLDEDVLNALKDLASKSGGRYQTVLNQLLRQILVDDALTIMDRLQKLEKAVFNKRAA